MTAAALRRLAEQLREAASFAGHPHLVFTLEAAADAADQLAEREATEEHHAVRGSV